MKAPAETGARFNQSVRIRAWVRHSAPAENQGWCGMALAQAAGHEESSAARMVRRGRHKSGRNPRSFPAARRRWKGPASCPITGGQSQASANKTKLTDEHKRENSKVAPITPDQGAPVGRPLCAPQASIGPVGGRDREPAVALLRGGLALLSVLVTAAQFRPAMVTISGWTRQFPRP